MAEPGTTCNSYISFRYSAGNRWETGRTRTRECSGNGQSAGRAWTQLWMRTLQPFFGWILSRCVSYASCTQKPQAENRNLRLHSFNRCTGSIRPTMSGARRSGVEDRTERHLAGATGLGQDAPGHRIDADLKPATRLTCFAMPVVRVKRLIVW